MHMKLFSALSVLLVLKLVFIMSVCVLENFIQAAILQIVCLTLFSKKIDLLMLLLIAFKTCHNFSVM